MSCTVSRAAVAAIVMASFAGPVGAQTGSTAVLGTSNIYAAGDNSGLNRGTTPNLINLTAGTGRALTFASIVGSWGCNGFNAYSADGFSSTGARCVGDANVSSLGVISGLNTPGRSMTLVGLFLGAGLPASAPGTINYGTVGYGFASISGLLLGQQFFIGDGRTTDVLDGQPQSGSVQSFAVPDGATRLFLGIADACGFTGPPSCYDDNTGFMNVNFSILAGVFPVSTVPEPSTYALMGAGLLAVGLAARRRRE